MSRLPPHYLNLNKTVIRRPDKRKYQNFVNFSKIIKHDFFSKYQGMGKLYLDMVVRWF